LVFDIDFNCRIADAQTGFGIIDIASIWVEEHRWISIFQFHPRPCHFIVPDWRGKYFLLFYRHQRELLFFGKMFLFNAFNGGNFNVFQIIESRINQRVSFIFIPLRNGNFSVSDSDKGIFVLGSNCYVLI